MARLLINLLLLLFLSAGASSSAAAAQTAESLAAMRALDVRVAAIGHRLAVTSLDWCRERAWLPGFVIHDLSQYRAAYRADAARTFGLDAGPGVLALVPGGPSSPKERL